MHRSRRSRDAELLVGVCVALAVILAGGWTSAEEKEATQRIRAALTKPTPTDISFQETPLTDVLAFFKDASSINIVFNRRKLEDAGIVPEDTLVNRELKGVSLKSALNLILSEVGLTYVIKDEVLMITSLEDAKATSMPRVYDVSGLELEEEDAEALIEAVRLVLDPDPPAKPKAPDAGPAIKPSSRIQVFQDRLILRASPREHDRVEELLERLRKKEAAEKIRAALTKPTVFSFQETPLTDVVTFLKDVHGINVVVNRRTLEDAGIVPEDTLITRRLKGVSLKSALNLMLADLGLTYVIKDEVLMITSLEDAKATSVPRVYDVSALELEEEDAEALIKAVRLVLDPDPPAKPRALDAGPAPEPPSRIQVFQERLMLRASPREHDRVEELLERLRKCDKPRRRTP